MFLTLTACIQILVEMIQQKNIFGTSNGFTWNKENQKRELPHTHNLWWINFTLTPERVDRCISAEIPDVSTDPELHALVVAHMIHGPCGDLNPSAPCMRNGKCSKNYPFDFQPVSLNQPLFSFYEFKIRNYYDYILPENFVPPSYGNLYPTFFLI